MTRAITIAADGITGPSGTVILAAGTWPAKPGLRSRSAAAHVATYTTRRLTALAAAMPANVPVVASASDTAAVNRIAMIGVTNFGLTLAKTRGTSPFSASANKLREPDSAWPILFPSVESTAPSVMTAAPVAPIMRAEASASGVFDAARSGSVASATTCASVRTTVTTTMVMTSAKGTVRCGSRDSPAGTGSTSDPTEEDTINQ